MRIGRSTVSTGKKGHGTPTGVFTILQRKVDHESSIYKGAKMPHMQRLTWDGIAIHAGSLPGYPASHGCVRVPVDFAEKLYSVTSIGTTVIIADDKSAPRTTTNPGLLFAGAEGGAAPAGPLVWQPEKAPEGPVSIVLSAADGAAYIYRSGVEIGRAPVGGLQGVSGSHAFSALEKVDAKGRRDWLSVTSVGGATPDLKALADRMTVDAGILASTRALIVPGTSMILTDAPVNADTHGDVRLPHPHDVGRRVADVRHHAPESRRISSAAAERPYAIGPSRACCTAWCASTSRPFSQRPASAAVVTSGASLAGAVATRARRRTGQQQLGEQANMRPAPRGTANDGRRIKRPRRRA